MAFVDQAPDFARPAPLAIVQPRVVAPPALGQAAPSSPWPTLLLLGAVAGIGYLVWRQVESDSTTEEPEPGIWVFMYDDEDDQRYSGEGWPPRASMRFDRRSDAEAYKAQQLPHFDKVEIAEVTA